MNKIYESMLCIMLKPFAALQKYIGKSIVDNGTSILSLCNTYINYKQFPCRRLYILPLVRYSKDVNTYIHI